MKRLLLAFAGLSVIGATAQEAQVDLGRSAEMYVANHADGIPYNTSANKQSSAVAIGTAPNVYGTGFGPKTNIWADEDLNTIVFLHRSDYGTNGDNSSGSLRFDYSTNGGSTWTANAGPVYNPNLSGYAYPGFARYPHIGILNESGNTNPLNASISVWAPTLAGTNAGAWGGALMGTHKMDNTTTNMSVDTTGGHLTLENSYVDGGTFWGLSFDHPDYQNTEYTDTALIWKGTMDWTTDSMTYTEHKAYLPVTNDPTNGKIYGDGKVFFASNKTTGYVSIEAYDSTIAPDKVIHPYLIKTTDGGSTWSAAMGPNMDLLVDNGSGDSLVDIFDMIT
ncbi:MAG: hypothetical protein ACO3K3_06275, partial [Schleiferiaceae bacterium]